MELIKIEDKPVFPKPDGRRHNLPNAKKCGNRS